MSPAELLSAVMPFQLWVSWVSGAGVCGTGELYFQINFCLAVFCALQVDKSEMPGSILYSTACGKQE